MLAFLSFVFRRLVLLLVFLHVLATISFLLSLALGMLVIFLTCNLQARLGRVCCCIAHKSHPSQELSCTKNISFFPSSTFACCLLVGSWRYVGFGIRFEMNSL